VAGILHSLLPPPFERHLAERSEKLRMLDDWHGRVNSAAFGTSRVHNGFSPAAFDAVFANASYRIASLNVGLFGGSQTEQRAFAKSFIARLDPPRGQPSVCLILLELDAGLNFQPVNLFHPRSIDIYDLDTVRFVASFSGENIALERRIGRMAFAVISGILHFANIGMIGSSIFDWPMSDHGSAPETSSDSRGLLTVPADQKGVHAVTETFERPRGKPTPYIDTLTPGNGQLPYELAAGARIPRLQFVYFVFPKLSSLDRFPIYPTAIPGPNGPVPIINLSRPDRFPELFKPQLWANPGHLNSEGAAAVSAVLAREVRSRLEADQAVPLCSGAAVQ